MKQDQYIKKYQSKSNKRQRRTIGVLVDDLRSGNQNTIVNGVSSITNENDINLICFIGGMLDSSLKYSSNRNIIYNLVSTENVDGLIILADSLGTLIDTKSFAEFIKKFNSIPTISIGMLIEGIPSLSIDYYNGVRNIISHLIINHQFQRIAFYHRHEGHPEGNAQFKAYTDTLCEFNLQLDEKLIVPSKYYESPCDGIQLLLDDRQVTPDAIVVPDDYTALIVLEELKKRSIQVPNDVAIVGFGDIEESKYCIPTLTTVSQSLYEQGRQAAEMLAAWIIEGKELSEQSIFPTKLIIRQSCGCIYPSIKKSEFKKTILTNSVLKDEFSKIKARILSDIQKMTIEPIHSQKWFERLLDSFSDTLDKKQLHVFLSTLSFTSQHLIATSENVDYLYDLLSLLQEYTLPYLRPEDKNLIQKEKLWQQAHMVIAQTIQKVLIIQRLNYKKNILDLLEISNKLTSTFNINSLLETLAEELPKINIIGCFLVLYMYDDIQSLSKIKYFLPEFSKLILKYNKVGHEITEQMFKTELLVPDNKIDDNNQYSIVIEPLYFQKKQLGFIIFKMWPFDGLICEELRTQISNAINYIEMYQQMQKRLEQLEKLQADVNKLEQNIEVFNKNYTASATSIGIFHTANKILNVTRPLLNELSNKNRIKENAKLYDLVQRISAPIDQLTTFYNGIKNILQGYQLKFETCNLWMIVNDVITLLKPTIKERELIVTNNIDKNKYNKIDGDPLYLKIVFMNLFTNSIEANSRHINILAYNTQLIRSGFKKDCVEVLFEDDGIGIIKEEWVNIFSPYFSKYKDKGTGTGLGLYVNNDILKKHNGTISIKSSQVGKGTTFTIIWPKILDI